MSLRKVEFPDFLQDALTRITRSGWKEVVMTSADAELKLEWTLAMWLSQFCCAVLSRCAAGVHSSVYCALQEVSAQAPANFGDACPRPLL